MVPYYGDISGKNGRAVRITVQARSRTNCKAARRITVLDPCARHARVSNDAFISSIKYVSVCSISGSCVVGTSKRQC